jgi:hypothetical protein
MQVPLMITGNAVVNESQRGKTADAGVSFIDLAATFLEIGGLKFLRYVKAAENRATLILS